MSNISDKEKAAAISLLEARIERMTGKKVTYTNNTTDEIKALHEQLETLTGKKVVYTESKAKKLSEAVKKFIAENQMTTEEVAEYEEGFMQNVLSKVTGGKGVKLDGTYIATSKNAETAKKYGTATKRLMQLVPIDANQALEAAAYLLDTDLMGKFVGGSTHPEYDQTTKIIKFGDKFAVPSPNPTGAKASTVPVGTPTMQVPQK